LNSIIRGFKDPELFWHELDELEMKMALHVKAIDAGCDTAIECGLSNISDLDEDRCLGSVFILANLILDDETKKKIFDIYSNSENENIWAFVEGFKYGDKLSLMENSVGFINHENPLIASATAEVLGYRRDGDPRQLWPLLHHEDEDVNEAAVIALMRHGYKEAVPAMEQIVQSATDEQRKVLLFALLFLGSQNALSYFKTANQSDKFITPSSIVTLALCGGPDQLQTIIQAAQFPGMAEAAIQAAGILGLPEAFSNLLHVLQIDNDDYKAAAGEALNLITGAQLLEQITKIEEEEPDLDVEEIIGADPNKDPDDEDEEEIEPPREIEVIRACTDLERWNQWLRENGNRFTEGKRYRNGELYSLKSCIDEIENPESNYETRSRAYSELVIRSGHHIPFEPDWFVSKQLKAIEAMKTWWQSAAPALQSQQWLFDGK